MEHKIKLGNTIVFDNSQEKDIIKSVDELAGKRQLGKFIEESIRLVFNHPKEAKLLGFPYNTGETRKTFFEAVNSEMNKLADKVDKIYEQALIVYIAQKLGSGLALGERAENIMEATIELEKQVKTLSDSLGLSAGSRIFSRNQNQNTEEQAEKVIEFIKDNYKQFIDSITSDINNRANVVYIQAPNNVTEQPNTVNTEVVDDTLEVLDILDKDNDKAKKVFEVLDNSTEEQEAFAFEESADMEALERFMGL